MSSACIDAIASRSCAFHASLYRSISSRSFIVSPPFLTHARRRPGASGRRRRSARAAVARATGDAERVAERGERDRRERLDRLDAALVEGAGRPRSRRRGGTDARRSRGRRSARGRRPSRAVGGDLRLEARAPPRRGRRVKAAAREVGLAAAALELEQRSRSRCAHGSAGRSSRAAGPGRAARSARSASRSRTRALNSSSHAAEKYSRRRCDVARPSASSARRRAVRAPAAPAR